MRFLFLLLANLALTAASYPTPRCPPNMIPSQEDSTICYLFVETPKTFHEAESFCNQNHGNLVPIFDQFTNFFISVNANPKFNGSSDFWIGGKLYTDLNSAGTWIWTWNNALMIYNDWQMNQPNPNFSCVASNMKTALWSSEDCAKPFVCQIPALVDVCDSGWSYYDQTGMCYKLFAQLNITFYTAEKMCNKQNATLASVHSDAENAFLAEHATFGISERWQDEAVWIGLEFKNGDWRWNDKTPFNYEAWRPDRPWTEHSVCCAWLYPDGVGNGTSPEKSGDFKKWDSPACLQQANRYFCKRTPSSVFVV